MEKMNFETPDMPSSWIKRSASATQRFSKGIEGKKGVLWWQIRDTIIAKKPPFCLLENVDRLLKSPAKQRGRDFGVILACLNDLGYSAEWRVVNASRYGGAQRRTMRDYVLLHI